MPIITEQNHMIKTGKKEYFLHPRGFHFSKTLEKIETLLGSCIAIALWYPVLKRAGMCHFVLPHRLNNKGHKELDGRYANDSIKLFEQSEKKQRTLFKEYQVKTFGGGNHLPH